MPAYRFCANNTEYYSKILRRYAIFTSQVFYLESVLSQLLSNVYLYSTKYQSESEQKLKSDKSKVTEADGEGESYSDEGEGESEKDSDNEEIETKKPLPPNPITLEQKLTIQKEILL